MCKNGIHLSYLKLFLFTYIKFYFYENIGISKLWRSGNEC